MDKKYVYVCLSECRQIAKVGISQDVRSRVISLKQSEGQSFSLLFCSKKLTKIEAIEIEKQVFLKFKDFIVKGNEWYSAKPIIIIEFLITCLKLEPLEVVPTDSEFPSWIEGAYEYNKYKPSSDCPHIRENKTRGLYSIAYLNGDKVHYIGFCNLGDAKKFYSSNKMSICIIDNLLELLYNTDAQTLRLFKIPTKNNLYGLRTHILDMKDKLQDLIGSIDF